MQGLGLQKGCQMSKLKYRTQYLGHTCSKKSCSVYLKFKFKGASCILSSNSVLKFWYLKTLQRHVQLFGPHGLQPTRLLGPWDFLGESTGLGCHFLLQGIFLTQGSNPGLPHCRQTLYHLSHQGSPYNCIQFSSVVQSCLTLCDPMNRSTPGLPIHHQLPEFTQTHVHRVGDAIQPSHPLSSPSPPALNLSQHQGLFQ